LGREAGDLVLEKLWGKVKSGKGRGNRNRRLVAPLMRWHKTSSKSGWRGGKEKMLV